MLGCDCWSGLRVTTGGGRRGAVELGAEWSAVALLFHIIRMDSWKAIFTPVGLSGIPIDIASSAIAEQGYRSSFHGPSLRASSCSSTTISAEEIQ